MKSTEDLQRNEELKAAQHNIENLSKNNEELHKTNQTLEKKRKDDARILLEMTIFTNVSLKKTLYFPNSVYPL